MLTQHEDKVIMHLQKCGKCNRIVELMGFKAGQESFESLLYKIMQDRDSTLTLDFDEFHVYCPVHKDQVEHSTYLVMDADEIDLMRKTPLSKVWITID